MLLEIIKDVCENKPNSFERRKAVNKLLIEIQKLPKLGQSGSIYRLDAFNRTCEYVIRSLCSKFDFNQPNVEKRFVQWFNKTFYWRLYDLKCPQNKSKNVFISLDMAVGENSTTKLLDLLTEDGLNPPQRDSLDFYIEQIERNNREDLSDRIKQYLTEDPDKKLSSCHPKKSSQCNCQYLVQRPG